MNDPEENDAFQNQTTLNKEKQIHSQKTTRKGTQMLPEQRKQERQ